MKMQPIKIFRKVYGSIHETFRQSYTYFISAEDAKKMGDVPGIIAIDVSRKNDGFEFFLRCEENEAIQKVKNFNGMNIIFVDNEYS